MGPPHPKTIIKPPPSLAGREHVDFLLQFSERGLWSQLKSVLSALSGQDLSAVALVSPMWNSILASSSEHDQCRRAYVAAKRCNRENELGVGSGQPSLPTRSSPRLALQVILFNHGLYFVSKDFFYHSSITESCLSTVQEFFFSHHHFTFNPLTTLRAGT